MGRGPDRDLIREGCQRALVGCGKACVAYGRGKRSDTKPLLTSECVASRAGGGSGALGTGTHGHGIQRSPRPQGTPSNCAEGGRQIW